MGCAQGRTQHFSLWRDKSKGPRAGGVLGEGAATPPRHLGVCRSAAGFGVEPRPPKGVPLFSALRTASPDTIMLLIVDRHAAITYAPVRYDLAAALRP